MNMRAQYTRAVWWAAALALVLATCGRANADLTAGDAARLTRDLQTIARGWDQPSVDDANTTFFNPAYGIADWSKFFQEYFANNPFPDPLAEYLVYPLAGWLGSDVHARLQGALFPLITKQLSDITAGHRTDLGAAMQNDPTLRDQLISGQKLLGILPLWDFQLDGGSRTRYISFYHDYILAYPQFFQHSARLSPTTQQYLGYLQMQVVSNYVDANHDDPAGVVSTLGLTGAYRDIFNQEGVLLLDNNGFDTRQLTAFGLYFHSIPPGLSRPWIITVNDLYGPSGTHPPHLNYRGANIFAARLGEAPDNQFPDDIAPHTSDGWTIVLAHEANHTVNGLDIEPDPVWGARQRALLAAAGTDHRNYLRSMFPDGTFIDAPQEFFASIANEWFSSSFHTLELGIQRFRGGRPQPLNQVLFIADVYSVRGGVSHFYQCDASGNLTRQDVPLTRDVRGHITSLRPPGWLYGFDVDDDGNVLAVRVTSGPTAPGQLRATASSQTEVHLSWTDRSSNETGFEIDRRTSGGAFAHVGTVPANASSYDDGGLSPGTTYIYQVRAVNAAASSTPAGPVSVTTLPNPPAAPTGLAAVALSATQLRLTWTDQSDNEGSFEVEHSTDGTGFSFLARVSVNVTTYTHAGLAPQSHHYYRVRAVNAGGPSGYSNTADALTSAGPPAPPTGLTARAVSSGEIRLAWTDASSDETGFKVERRRADEAVFTVITAAPLPADSTSYSDTGVLPGTTYLYRVRATGAGEDSTYSNSSTATTPPAAVLRAFTILPGKVRGGKSVTATVTLSGPAPSSGAEVLLTSSSPAAPVPSSATVPPGQSTVSWTISTHGVRRNVTAKLTASYGGQKKTATLSIRR